MTEIYDKKYKRYVRMCDDCGIKESWYLDNNKHLCDDCFNRNRCPNCNKKFEGIGIEHKSSNTVFCSHGCLKEWVKICLNGDNPLKGIKH